MNIKIGNYRTKQYFSKFLDPQFIFSTAFIPIAVLSVYFVLFAYLLPDGVNKVFAEKSWKYTLLLAAAAGVMAIVLNGCRKQSRRLHMSPGDNISTHDLILLLLPLMPVVQYIIYNQEILPLLQLAFLLIFFLVFTLIFIILIPKLLSRIASARTLMLLGASFTMTLLNMASLSYSQAWFGQGSLKFQWLILGGIFVISWFLDDLKYRNFLYWMIIVLFLTNSARHYISRNGLPFSSRNEGANIHENDLNLMQWVGDREPASKPNIYLLVYDGYAHNETMLAHGIDNSQQEQYLTGLGFSLYPNTYSVASISIDTMGRVLNASVDDGSAAEGVAGDSVVSNLLKSFGYHTNGIFFSDYFLRAASPKYDYTFPEVRPTSLVLAQAILEGEFLFDEEFTELDVRGFLAAKRSILGTKHAGPTFLYAHSRFPRHSQFSGRCLPDETQLFAQRLQIANREMQQDLELLIRNDPGAIIIVAGDHGPYLTKNCTYTSRGGYDLAQITRLDIQDRYGTFLAIRWPSDNFQRFDDIQVLQDLFPSVFAYLFYDPSILESKVDPMTIQREAVSGAYVDNGVIHGGLDDGEPLFLDN